MLDAKLDKIDAKLDSIQESIAELKTEHHGRIIKLETTQRGVIALCLAVISAAFTALAKALHLV